MTINMIPGFDPLTRNVARALGIPRSALVGLICVGFGLFALLSKEYSTAGDWLLFLLFSAVAVGLAAWIDRPRSDQP